nr:Mariner Mos1 transposase [Hymenolepis microstoma]
MRLSRALEEKRPRYNRKKHDKVINARPHEMGQSGEKIYRNVEMGNFASPVVLYRCCFVSFSPHSPHLMAHDWLGDQHFSSYEVKNWIDSWILSKDEKCFHCGIHLLAERWAKVVANDGQYFET